MAPASKKKRMVKKTSEQRSLKEPADIETQRSVKKEQEAEMDDIEIKQEPGSSDANDTFEDPEEKQKKTGVVYFSMIPPKYNVVRIREYFEKLCPGEIGRIFLARNKHTKSQHNRYAEGWMELKKKKLAKGIAQNIDNTPIGGKNKDPVSSMLWNIRYLSGFKWVHLMEQLQYEKEVEKRRMNVEVAQARRIAAHFEEQIEKGRHLKKLEARVKSAGGKWDVFQRDVEQKKTLKKTKKERSKHVATESSELMNLIFQ